MKTILLAVVGLSPQVITETLYALHQQQRTVDAIHVMTTRRGREAIEWQLLSPRSGRYFQYLEDYGLPADSIEFGYGNIHTIVDEDGLEIDDIAGEHENELFLQKCLELTFRFTASDGSAVCFSIAGGRKTMSACLMVAAQLYARPQDRVYHVLVSPEFEGNENFYYPPKCSTPIELHDSSGLPYFRNSRHARVTLLHIPFITIRDQLAPGVLNAPQDPAILMSSLIRDEEFRFTVDLTTGKLIFKNRERPLMPARLALYAFFILQKRNCRKASKTCRGCLDCYLDFQEISARQNEITALYRQIAHSRNLSDMSDSGITGLIAENFNSYKGKIKKDLVNAFGLYAADQLAIEGKGKKPDTRYGIKMDRDRIRLIV
jgi:CRISPR-associated protein (TIGR02584 family)